MTTQTLLGVVGDVERDELAALLEAELARRGLRVLERIASAADPSPFERLDAHVGAQMFSLFEAPRDALAPPTTVVSQRLTGDGRWDPTLMRALSAAAGGFALALESRRSRDEYGLAVFYAGRTVEAEGWDYQHQPARPGPPAGSPRLDDDAAWDAFAARCRAVTEVDEAALRGRGAPEIRSWIVDGPGDIPAYRWDAASEAPLRRAVLIDVDDARIRDALSGAAPGLRWIARTSSVTSTPFVILDGDFELDWLAATAQALGVDAAAVHLRSPDAAFAWTTVVAPGTISRGVSRGGEALARVWSTATVALAEPAALIRWPSPPR